MKFYSSMWANKVTKCLHIPSFSYIHMNTKTSSFFITGGPIGQGKKFDFLGVSLCSKLFVNFDSVHSEGYIVIVYYQIFGQIWTYDSSIKENLSYVFQESRINCPPE